MPPKNKKKTWEAPPGKRIGPEPEPEPKLDWPPLTPVLPVEDLVINQVLPGQIITISNFFTSKLCKTYLNFLQQTIELKTTPGKPKPGYALRSNDRFQMKDQQFVDRLWTETGLKEVVGREDPEMWGGEVVGLNPSIRIYRYEKGQFFDKHYDESNQFSSGGDNPEVLKTTWTLLIYLTGSSDGIVGGETAFYTEATKKTPSETIIAPLEKGACLLHRHAPNCMLHEGSMVEEDGGVGKWIIRSDLCVKKKNQPFYM